MIRTFAQADVDDFATAGTIPVVNGLTDLLHPCQLMADVMTIQEEFGQDVSGLEIAWIGDGNNMANSWLNAARRFGFTLRLACPAGYHPDSDILQAAVADGVAELLADPVAAADGAHVVTTDVWASMGQEEEAAARARAFEGYMVDGRVMESASPDAIFLHCLPAHRGEEVAAEVIDGPASRAWDEAENRLHAQKAILARLMGGVK